MKGRDFVALTEDAKNARREYKRKWNRANPDKNRAYMERYWNRKAQSGRQKTAENGMKEGAEK